MGGFLTLLDLAVVATEVINREQRPLASRKVEEYTQHLLQKTRGLSCLDLRFLVPLGNKWRNLSSRRHLSKETTHKTYCRRHISVLAVWHIDFSCLLGTTGEICLYETSFKGKKFNLETRLFPSQTTTSFRSLLSRNKGCWTVISRLVLFLLFSLASAHIYTHPLCFLCFPCMHNVVGRITRDLTR